MMYALYIYISYMLAIAYLCFFSLGYNIVPPFCSVVRPLGGLGRQGATLQSGSGAEFSPRDVEETSLAPGSATRRRTRLSVFG